MIKYSVLLFLIISFFISCVEGQGDGDNYIENPIDTAKVNAFAADLIKSIHALDYEPIRNAWDKEAYRNKINYLTSAEEAAFNHHYEKHAKDIEKNNLNLINVIKNESGKVELSQVLHYKDHSELYFAVLGSESAYFPCYWVDMIGDEPKLTDVYYFKINAWKTDMIRNLIVFDSAYRSYARDHEDAGVLLKKALQHKNRGEYIAALDLLYQIDDKHFEGNFLTLTKIAIAIAHSDTITQQVLVREYQENNSLYMTFYNEYMYGDEVNYIAVMDTLRKYIGPNSIIDSLETRTYLW